jgi:hypothetical protein
VQRGDGAQAAFLEAEDARRAIAGGEGDQGAVGEAEVKIAIAGLETRRGQPVGSLVRDRDVVALVGELASEAARAAGHQRAARRLTP